MPESEALSALERQLRASEQSVSELSAELQENREMLVEAAEAYTNKDEEVDALTASLAQRTHTIAEQVMACARLDSSFICLNALLLFLSSLF